MRDNNAHTFSCPHHHTRAHSHALRSRVYNLEDAACSYARSRARAFKCACILMHVHSHARRLRVHVCIVHSACVAVLHSSSIHNYNDVPQVFANAPWCQIFRRMLQGTLRCMATQPLRSHTAQTNNPSPAMKGDWVGENTRACARCVQRIFVRSVLLTTASKRTR